MSSSPTNTLLSKTLGAILGVHAGDSLGATLEFETWRKVKSKYPEGLRDIVGGGPFSWSAGHATDDTDLTRAVLLAYRDFETHKNKASTTKAKGGTKKLQEFDIAKCAANYSLDWLEGRWPDREEGSQPRDVGGATYTGLSNYADGGDPRNCGAGSGSAGNGSLMRCIPTALFSPSPERRVKESMEISAITHNDERCTVSCAAYNEIVAALLEGKTPEEAVDVGIEQASTLGNTSVATAIERGKTMDIAEYAEKGPGKDLPQKTSGYVLQTFSVAIAALLDDRPLDDVLSDVVGIGGDTDTNGAIAGGLLGARDGVEAIPDKWLEKLQFREEFEEVAREILQIQGHI